MTLGDRVVVMNAGRLQQCAPPLEVFHRPSNRFVAGFVGAPPMNFLTGQVTQMTDGRLCVESPDFHLELTENQTSWVVERIGTEVVLGLRPEALQLTPREGVADHQQWCLSVTLDLVEPLGSLMDLYVVTGGGDSLVARVPVQEVDVLVELCLYIDRTVVQLFEPDLYAENSEQILAYGRNLSLPGLS